MCNGDSIVLPAESLDDHDAPVSDAVAYILTFTEGIVNKNIIETLPGEFPRVKISVGIFQLF